MQPPSMPLTPLTLGLLLIAPPAHAQENIQEESQQLRTALADYPFQLLFETNRDGNWELYVMAADGSSPTNLTNTPDVDEVYGKVSPDGQWIAFCADTEVAGKTRRDIYRMKTDGSARERIAEHARDPFWHPDGTALGYLPQEFEKFSYATWATRGLEVYSFDTGAKTKHPNTELEHLYTPTWTNDGEWIVATVHGGLGYRHAIIAIETDGPAVERLRIWGCRPDIAPDGKRITWGYGDYSLGLAYLDFDGDRPTASMDGHLVRNRRGALQTYHADWSPDGSYVAYSSGPKPRGRRGWASVTPQCPGVDAEGWDLWIADTRGDGLRIRLTRDGKSNKEPDWIPIPREAAPTATGVDK